MTNKYPKPKKYKGNSTKMAIIRKNTPDITCVDKKIDSMICLHTKDMSNIERYILDLKKSCRSWVD